SRLLPQRAAPRCIGAQLPAGVALAPAPMAPCPRRESNPDLRFRKPLFYPLNYGDNMKPASSHVPAWTSGGRAGVMGGERPSGGDSRENSGRIKTAISVPPGDDRSRCATRTGRRETEAAPVDGAGALVGLVRSGTGGSADWTENHEKNR